MKYAVINVKGNQHKVAVGDVFDIDLDKKAKKTLTFDEVLLISDNGKAKVGKPTIKGAKVKAKVLEQELKGKKLNIMRFKAKSRYRRRVGHRQKFTRIEITDILE